MKKKKPNGPNFHKRDQKESQKNKPKQPKTIWPELNPAIAYLLHSLTSISHISLVSTLNCNPFEALDL